MGRRAAGTAFLPARRPWRRKRAEFGGSREQPLGFRGLERGWLLKGEAESGRRPWLFPLGLRLRDAGSGSSGTYVRAVFEKLGGNISTRFCFLSARALFPACITAPRAKVQNPGRRVEGRNFAEAGADRLCGGGGGFHYVASLWTRTLGGLKDAGVA